MNASPENVRKAFDTFIHEWEKRLDAEDGEVNALLIEVYLDGKKWSIGNLLSRLMRDSTPLPEGIASFFGLARGATYGKGAGLAKLDLIEHRKRMYVVTLENPQSEYRPYFLAATTDDFAIDETISLFKSEDGLRTFLKSEIAVIKKLGRKIARVMHDEEGKPIVTRFDSQE